MGKRADGEGTIGYSESKDLWYCSLQIGSKANGKPDRIYRYGKTQKEVKDKLTELVHKYGTLRLSKDITLNAWYPEWVFEYLEVSDKTRQSYYGIWEKHIKPYAIGKMKLSDITKMDVKKHFNQLSRDGRSKQRILAVKHRLSACFNDGSEYIIKNPVINVQIPASAKDASRKYKNGKTSVNDEGKYNAFTVDEQKKFIGYIMENQKDIFNLLFITCLGTGIRLGEALALKYGTDLNEDFTELSITRNLQRVPVYDNRVIVRYELQELPPKSQAGIRIIHLPEILTKMLKKAELEKKLKARMDPFYTDNDLIFHDDLGNYIELKKPLRRLKRIEKNLNLSLINIHGLRHTFATRLFEVGEEIEVVSALLGHASVDITREVYVHILNDRKKKVVEKINEVLSQ